MRNEALEAAAVAPKARRGLTRNGIYTAETGCVFLGESWAIQFHQPNFISGFQRA
jgi:hypothetical protein